MLNSIVIAKYVEEFVNSIIKEKVAVRVSDDKYIIYESNKEIDRFEIFKFYNQEINQIPNYFNKENFLLKNDLVGTIFFFISGYWEYINNFPKDEYGRVSAKYSFLLKYDLLETPIVDILLKNFILKNNFHYKNNEPRYFLTHDIDKLYYKVNIRNLLGDILKRKDLKYFLKNLKIFIFKTNPFSVEKLMNLNTKYGVNSNYYFLLENINSTSGYNLSKNLRELSKIREILNKSRQNIGLHYSFNHLLGDELSIRSRELINYFKIKNLTGRAHYLNFDIKESFKVYEKGNIKLDCTGGYHDCIGFRFGTSFPFKPFNFEKNEKYDLIEIPLTIMDCTPFDYMNLTIKEGEKRILNLMNKIIDTNGLMCILWHNSSFWTREWKVKEKVYLKILEKIQDYKSYDINGERNV